MDTVIDGLVLFLSLRAAGCPLRTLRPGALPLKIDLLIDPTFYVDDKQRCYASLNISWKMMFSRPQPLDLEESGSG